jgi:electron transfer flavoprotein alpha subunit
MPATPRAGQTRSGSLTSGTMFAVIPIRAGELPSGGAEAVCEAGGRVVLVGEQVAAAADALVGVAVEIWLAETGVFAPAGWTEGLADFLSGEPQLVLPGCADGRDLAPLLARRLGRPLLAGAIEVGPAKVRLARRGGLMVEESALPVAFVATLVPGVRGVEPPTDVQPTVHHLSCAVDGAGDAVSIEVLPPDLATMDLAEAPRIVGGGAGLDTKGRFDQLTSVAAAIGASVGATRVITDKGWVGHERQIGTTGVVVDPELYLAFGISGAVQHTSGLGQPDHIISVNTDPHCPMMQLADLAIVSDANATLDALLVALTEREGADHG